MFKFLTGIGKKSEKRLKDVTRLQSLIQKKNREIKELKEEIRAFKQVGKTDLAREALGIMPRGMVFTANEDVAGMAVPPLPVPDEKRSPEDYRVFLANVNAIQRNPTWRPIIEYLINFQGNYTFLNGDSFKKEFNGRSVIEGIDYVRAFVEEWANKLDTLDEADDSDPHEIVISPSQLARDVMEEFSSNNQEE